MKKFLRDALSELHSVTWPTRKYAINIAKITLGFVLVSAIFIWIMDYIFSSGYNFIFTLNPKNNIIYDTPSSTSWINVLDWSLEELDSSWSVINEIEAETWSIDK